MVQKTLGGPFAPWAQKSGKDLLHPPLTTFADFPFLGNFPGPQHPKGGGANYTASLPLRRRWPSCDAGGDNIASSLGESALPPPRGVPG